MCDQSGAGEYKGFNSCAALKHSMQYYAPQHSTHVGWAYNATTGIAHIPGIVLAPKGDMVKKKIIIILLGLVCNN